MSIEEIEQADPKAENWSAARKAIRLMLRSSPDDHWLLTRLGLTYYRTKAISPSSSR